MGTPQKHLQFIPLNPGQLYSISTLSNGTSTKQTGFKATLNRGEAP
jgi:hypothetical protein